MTWHMFWQLQEMKLYLALWIVGGGIGLALIGFLIRAWIADVRRDWSGKD